MQAGGWVLMITSWIILTGLAGFCLDRVLRGPRRSSRERD